MIKLGISGPLSHKNYLEGKYICYNMYRTDNCVKNHFYSKMRKAIRKLNKIIYQYYKKEIK